MLYLKRIYNKKNEIIRYTFCFYMILQLLSITSIFFGQNQLEIYLKICRYICYSIFALNIIAERKNISKEEIILVLLSIIISYISKNKSLIITLLIIMAIKKIDLEKIFKTVYKSLIIIFFTIIILSILQLIPDWTYMRGNIVRHSMGFIYPTDCASVFLMLTLLYLYNNKLNITWYHFAWIEIVNIFLFKCTDSRLSFLLINFALIVAVTMKIKKFKTYLTKNQTRKKLRIIAYIMPIFFLVLTNYLIFLPTKSVIFERADTLLSRRIINSKNAYEKYGIHPFGKKIEWKGWGGYGYIKTEKNYEYNYVDNSYARILLEYGIIFTIILVYGYIKLLLYCSDKNIVLYIIIGIILIWSFVEPCIVNISRNIFVISFSLLFNNNYLNSRCLHEKINKKELRI